MSFLFVQPIQEGALRCHGQDLTLVLVEGQNLIGAIQLVEIVDDHVRTDDHLVRIQTVDHERGQEENEKTEKRQNQADLRDSDALRVIDEEHFEECEAALCTQSKQEVDDELHQAVSGQQQRDQGEIVVKELQIARVLELVRPDEMAQLVGADRDHLAHLQLVIRVAELLRYRVKVQLIAAYQMRGTDVLDGLLDAFQLLVEEIGQPENAVSLVRKKKRHNRLDNRQRQSVETIGIDGLVKNFNCSNQFFEEA